MAKTAQTTAEIAGERAHISTFAALGLQHRMVWIGHVNEIQSTDFNWTRLELDFFAVAGKIVCTLALNFDSRRARRDLLDCPRSPSKQRPDPDSRRALTLA